MKNEKMNFTGAADYSLQVNTNQSYPRNEYFRERDIMSSAWDDIDCFFQPSVKRTI